LGTQLNHSFGSAGRGGKESFGLDPSGLEDEGRFDLLIPIPRVIDTVVEGEDVSPRLASSFLTVPEGFSRFPISPRRLFVAPFPRPYQNVLDPAGLLFSA
jgi:hypothetical protein